jgi:transketolase
VSGLYPVLPKWEAFGWHGQEIDGHDLRAILTAVERAQAETDRPSCIVARTVKGKGIPFMEADNSWHKRVPTKDELEAALAALA